MTIVRVAALAAALVLGSGGMAAADPLEPFNRAMFTFNQKLVTHVINPTVDAVAPWMPAPVVGGLANAYSNLTEIEFILNNALVGDFKNVGVSATRFIVNSTVGLAGVFDVAGAAGLRRVEREFGESLCQTGLPPGPYLVLPFVGPSNAVSAPTLIAGIALEVWGLSFISATLATADFIIIDMGGSAAALRHATDTASGPDPYAIQRAEYVDYITKGCAPKPLANSTQTPVSAGSSSSAASPPAAATSSRNAPS